MTFSVVFQWIFSRFSVVTSIITRTEISFFMYNTHAWFRIDTNHRNILFVVVFIHFELRFYVLERYFRTHSEILDHFVSKSNLTYSVNYYDIFSDLTLSVFYWILLNFKIYWIYWMSRGFYWISQPSLQVRVSRLYCLNLP